MRFYHYKELLKVFAINFKKPEFESTRNSVYMFLLMPSLVALSFNLISPFSIFRGIAVYGTFGASITCFV